MRLDRIEISNFGPFQGIHRINLRDRGLVSILGRNLLDPGSDANGVGKSSILDALTWGLFGETTPRRATSTASGLKTDEVICDAVGKDCVVTVYFADAGGGDCSVRRWRKAKPNGVKRRGSGLEFKTSENELLNADLDSAAVQKRIDESLGMDHSLFCQVVVRSQEDTWNFCQATANDRGQILERVEGLEEISLWQEALRKSALAAKSTRESREAEALGITRALDAYETTEADLKSQAEAWESDRARRLEEISVEIAAEAEREGAQREECAKKPATMSLVRGLSEELTALAQAPDDADIRKWTDYRMQLSGEIATARSTLQQTEQRLLTARATGPACSHCGKACPDCAQALESVLASVETECASTIATWTSHVEALQAKDAEAVETLAKAQAEQARLQAEREAKRSEIQAKIDAGRSVIQAIDAVEVTIGKAGRKLVQDLEAARESPNPYTDQLEAHLKKRKELEDAKAGCESTALEAKAAEELASWWVRSLPSFRSWILDGVVGEITAKANEFLAMLTGGLFWVQIESTASTKGGDVRDNVGLRCFRWNPDGTNTERQFRQWSGGEKRRISLAVDLALQARLSQRAAVSTNLLAMDEVDRHLDAEGRRGLLSVLDKLRDQHETILVVTHDAELQASPDSRWVVEKTAAGSRIIEMEAAGETA